MCNEHYPSIKPEFRTVVMDKPQTYFDFFSVDETDYLSETYNLRYQVYCNERHFLDPDNYPDQLERDPFDANSIHVGGINKERQLVGTFRLVLPSEQGFPMFQHCTLFDQYKALADISHQNLAHFGELSRLAVSKSYRRRAGDELYGLASLEDDPQNRLQTEHRFLRRRRPELVLGLYKAIYQASKQHGITHWFAAMEDSLCKLLSRYCFSFVPIGPETDYFGPVTPYMAKIFDMEERVHCERPQLFKEFICGLDPKLLPAFAQQT